MQKITIACLMSLYFAANCLQNEAVAAGNPARSDLESLPGAASAAILPGLTAQQSADSNSLSLTRETSHELARQPLDPVTDHGIWFTDEGRSASRSAIHSTILSANAQQLISAIRNASVHGLNPDSYGLSQIQLTVDALTAMDTRSSPSGRLVRTTLTPASHRLRKSLSAWMDYAFVRLATHLGRGVVDARSTQRRLFRVVPHVNTERLLESIWSGRQSVAQALESVTPAQADYQRLTTRMRDLLTERVAGVDRPVIGNHGTLSASRSHVDVLHVKHRLVQTGELPPSTVLTPYFDADLVSALRQFQQRNGLEPNGGVDKVTREALNVGIDDDIRAVALSLERWRWMPRELGQKHLYINIPDYRVVFRDGPETKMSMVAVVGAVEHQTPAFSRNMSYMEFNPTWTVPQSIAERELIPKERNQPGYLKSQRFNFLTRVDNQLVVVPPETVTAADFQNDPFPYTLQQRGGAGNELGRIKFMMPNPFAIYLHDTPHKNHFTLNERAYSHGCIRLSDPVAMATLLMMEDGYTPRDIRKSLQKPRTHRIELRTPIPTHLTYMTTWIDSTGALQRRADIYQYDAALMIALQASNTLVSTLNQPTASLGDPTVLASSKI